MPIYLKRYISKVTEDTAVTNLYKYTPSVSKVLSAKGELFGLITVSKTPQGYAGKGTKFVWDAVLDSYFSSNAGSIIEDIKRALSAGSKKLLELIKFDKQIAQQGIDLSFAVVAIKDSTAYIGIFGEQQVFLIKGDQWVSISDILTQNKAMAASIAISYEDTLFLGSPNSLGKLRAQGDSMEIIGMIERNGVVFEEGEGVAFVSRSRFEAGDVVEPVIDEFEEKLPDPEVQPDVPTAVEEVYTTPVMEVTREDKGERMAQIKEKLEAGLITARDVWAKIKNILLALWNTTTVAVSPLFKVLQKLGDTTSRAFWRLFDDKYGRKLWYKRLRSRLSSLKLWGGSSAYGMRVDGYKVSSLRGKRMGMVLGGVALVAVILIGLKLSANARESREIHDQAAAVISSVDTYVVQAEGSLPGDSSSAETFVFSAQEELKKLEGKTLSVEDGRKVSDLRNKLQALDDRIAKRNTVSEDNNSFELYFDSRITLGENSNPTDLVIYKDEFQNEQLYIVDGGLSGVYKINLYDKTHSKIPDSGKILKAPKFADVGVKGLYIYDETSGVVRSQFGNSGENKDFQTLTGLERDDLSVNDVAELAIFTENDNVYLLSPGQNAILKSTFTGSGYGLPSTYITSESFADAKDFFGDYAIYTLSSGSEGLGRFAYNSGVGKVDTLPVSIVGLTPDLSAATAGYTGGTLDNYLYVFDSADKRMISFEKPKESAVDQRHPNEMHLVKQYVYRGDRKNVFNNVADIVVDSAEKNMYILDGTTVWRMSL